MALKHEGLQTHRLTARADNPREVAFAKEWAAIAPRTLAILFRVPCSDDDPNAIAANGGGYYTMPLGEPTQRDATVAATLIQWLGSNVGFFILREALGKCGFEIQDTSGPRAA